jgi:hypothetical protein
MLFLLIMEVLSTLLYRADDWQLLQDLGVHAITHHAALYADDLNLFVKLEAWDLLAL